MGDKVIESLYSNALQDFYFLTKSSSKQAERNILTTFVSRYFSKSQTKFYFLMEGFIQVYTGNGKGKTTAAIGLSIRAVGAGKKVFFAQFVKGLPYSEIELIKKNIPSITLKQFGLECFIEKLPTQADIDIAQKGLQEVKTIVKAGEYDIVVLDEANIALFFKLFSTEDLIEVIKLKKPHTELIITGRYAPKEIIDMADLVTEMKEIKHYYNSGIQARKSIEY